MNNFDLFIPATDPEVERLHESTALYTQEHVVDSVLDQAGWPHRGGKLLDPGAGDGMFASRAIERLDTPIDHVDALTDRVEAWEIHPEAADRARERIAKTLMRRGWNERHARTAGERIVVQDDFLAPGPRRQRYQCVAGNPPYLRFAHLPAGFQKRYQDSVPDHARADLLHAFLDRCADSLADGGRLACVTADRWLFNESASGLRHQIGQRFGVGSIERLDARSTFYRPKQRKAGTPPRVHPVVVVLEPAAHAARPLTPEPIYPDSALQMDVPDSAVPLGEIATVRIAPWLGPHGVFTLDADRSAHLPADALVPCIDTKEITGSVATAPTRVAIRTSADAVPDPAVIAHLEATRHQLSPRARRDPFWLPPESWGDLPYASESLLIPRIAKDLRTVRLPAGTLPINHNVSVIGGNIGIDMLEDVLGSELSLNWIRVHAPRLENGYLSITTKLLRRLPVVLP